MTILKVAAGIAVLGLLGALAGLVPIAASPGHWAITERALVFVKNRAISTQSRTITAPPLDDPRLVLRGATHYDVGCRFCHGSPEHKRPRVTAAMLPPPVYLPDAVRGWSAAELFFPVKHGLKFTGMPAWPAQTRDDEVWAVVAFLRKFPELDAAGYRKLAGSNEQGCARCHNDKNGGAFPALSAQSPEYLRASLEAYASGARHSGIMGPIAAALSPDAIQKLAGELAAARRPAPKPADAAAVARGRAIAEQGVPARDVPACVECHGPRKNPVHPRLEGQDADYLVNQLALFRADARGGTSHAHLMRPVVQGLTPEQMRDVALFYSSQSVE